MKNFIGTAIKTFDDYFYLDLYAQLFARKIVPIATYFLFSSASDKVNIRRWVLNSVSQFVQGKGTQCPGVGIFKLITLP